MGTLRGPYNADFPEGTMVRVKPRPFLEEFRRTWISHHPIEGLQVEHAGKIAAVRSINYYHGGDELYELDGLPGIWHEACLERYSP